MVSYCRTFKCKENRRIHRAIQTNLVVLESWETWDPESAPATLRERYSQLVYEEKYRHRCIFCKKKKEVVSVSGKDAGQAYEQTLPGVAISSMIWCFAFVAAKTGYGATSVCRDDPSRSHLGGIVATVLDVAAPWVLFSQVELIMMFVVVTCCVLAQVGPFTFVTPCVTIGGPYGRVAIGAVAL